MQSSLNLARPTAVAARVTTSVPSVSRVSAVLPARRPAFVTRAEKEDASSSSVETTEPVEGASTATKAKDVNKELAKDINKVANTFAPRASGATGKNPAVPGTVLYDIFTYQAWAAVVVGGLLSFNIIYPSDKPDIARLIGMWSIWMFTIPSLRARDCPKPEKDALNYAFILIPLLNVLIPVFAKSFPIIFSADVITMAALYYWKCGPSAQEASEESA